MLWLHTNLEFDFVYDIFTLLLRSRVAVSPSASATGQQDVIHQITFVSHLFYFEKSTHLDEHMS